jgi:gluconolactonase
MGPTPEEANCIVRGVVAKALNVKIGAAVCGRLVALAAAVVFHTIPAASTPPAIAPSLPPTYVVDLMTKEGSAVFDAKWKTLEAKIVESPAIPNAMPEYKTTYDIQPHAGESGFDDSSWPVIDPRALAAERGGGKVSFIWFRANLRMPARVGDFDTLGARAVLTVNVDDYAEVWVNGQLPREPGRPSPATIQGFNMPNRIVLSDAAKAGDTFEVAVFGINGPISAAPANTVWFREAKVEFFR